MRYFSALAGGFFDDEIHGNNIPGDAVVVTKEQHALILAEQGRGKVISSDGDGRPVAIDPPAPSIAERMAKVAVECAAAVAAGVKVGQHWFRSDTESRCLYNGLMRLSSFARGEGLGSDEALQWDGKTVVLLTLEGLEVEVTPDLLEMIADELLRRDLSCFDVARSQRTAAADIMPVWPEAFGGK